MDFTSDYTIEDRRQNTKKQRHALFYKEFMGRIAFHTLKKVCLQTAHIKNGKKRAWSTHSLVLRVA